MIFEGRGSIKTVKLSGSDLTDNCADESRGTDLSINSTIFLNPECPSYLAYKLVLTHLNTTRLVPGNFRDLLDNFL